MPVGITTYPASIWSGDDDVGDNMLMFTTPGPGLVKTESGDQAGSFLSQVCAMILIYFHVPGRARS